MTNIEIDEAYHMVSDVGATSDSVTGPATVRSLQTRFNAGTL